MVGGELAVELVRAAARAGADAVKFQAFDAETLTTADSAKADYQQALGPAGETQRQMLRRYELSEMDFRLIRQACDQEGLDLIVTPFDVAWLERLAGMGLRCIKIGSGNLCCDPLFEAIAATNLPVIMSTGMADLDEIDRHIARLPQRNNGTLAILHCVSVYPTPPAGANLHAIGRLREHTQLTVGFSDHTIETITGALAVAAGATILEKHLTLDKTMDGPDHAMSLTPEAMADYIRLARQAAEFCGDKIAPCREELQLRSAARMSVVAARDIPADTPITRDMLTVKRPGTGIAADQLDRVIGKTATCMIPADTVMTDDLLGEAICHG